MKIQHFVSLFLCSMVFYACDNESTKEEYRTLFSAPKDTVIAKLRDIPQGFSIDGARDTIIQGTSGIKVKIGANVFVDDEGNPADQIKLELLEATNVQSFIENDLTTVSGDEILESGGMFYLNATSNGRDVNIKNNEALTLSVPSSGIMGDMNVFYGKRDEEGRLDWQMVEDDENMQLDFNMTAVPLKYLDYEGLSERLKENRILGHPVIAEEVGKLADPKYEGTFIATREFNERLRIHLMGAFTNPDKSTFKDVMDIYKKHINGNLWEADEEVVEYLTPHYDELMERMESEDDNLGFAKGFKEFGNLCWDKLKSFPEARYTNPIDFEKLGITAKTTKQDLIDKGMSPAQADRYLFMYDEYRAETNFENMKAYTVSVSKLGWVNIDRFLDDPNSKESELSVVVNGVEENTVKVMLVFPLRNICIEAINNEGNTYNFTNKNGAYRKLPIGEKAVIIGLSSQGGTPYYGTKKIKISESDEFTLELSETTMEGIKTSLASELKAKTPGI